ncbi:MAG: site-specific DNA-methyltransferase [Xanthobacteraceae bacterium]
MPTVSQAQITSLSKLRPNGRNARTHSKKQIQQIANSILRFGWTCPILTDEQGNILAGHGRYKAAETLGLREVPVVMVTGLKEAEKRALALADNKIAENAGWDRDILARELGELAVLLPEYSFDLDITGFAPAEIDSLMGDLVDPEEDPADDSPAIAKQPVSRSGDLWELGHHRLLCGDATKAANYSTLMAGEQATMMFTDPPYNVRIASVVGRGKVRHHEFVAASGEMSRAEFTRFLKRFMQLAGQHSVGGAINFVCIDWRHTIEIGTAGEAVFGQPKNLIVWTKTNAGQGSFYRSQHELIFVFKNGEDSAHINNFELGQHGRRRSNVWSYAGANTFRKGRMEDLSAHPTVKPVAMVADAIRDCSRRGDIVLDPFMGSGTTIMAAERVGRRGYGLELDPLYVDVAIRRWQAFTRRDAVLSSTGRTFDEVEADRAAKLTGGRS